MQNTCRIHIFKPRNKNKMSPNVRFSAIFHYKHEILRNKLKHLNIDSGVGRCQNVCVCVWGGGGGGGSHIHIIYVPSVKNQYKRVVFE